MEHETHRRKHCKVVDKDLVFDSSSSECTHASPSQPHLNIMNSPKKTLFPFPFPYPIPQCTRRPWVYDDFIPPFADPKTQQAKEDK
jgi:hypothetical protein